MRPAPMLVRRLFLFACAAAVVTVFGAFFLPDTIEVEETVEIAAPPAVVWGQIAELPKWEAWGPWVRGDTLVETKYTTPAGAIPPAGQMMTWSSRSQGIGRIKVTGAVPPQALMVACDFGETGDAGCSVTLTGTATGGTEVRCRLTSGACRNLSRRYFGLLVRSSVRQLVAEGLGGLKAHCEALPVVDSGR